ncbi:bifunctional protein-disulfide isomerase/oxidoreductase DsbC [Halopseudomonas salegens]|uniref:Thiol:disulfide interchange protein n=1 Tax=Halopseudomonas salegens TaxID=1434072 RepID=A0A1H2ECL5_9GAMM|nr:bifunctional protein-disulfide isomerase/oxidoreductase DsbC [Halopseudomonas salegens]SDT92709.1 Thiol:disulfide interchange protein DsbC [Halopseudomonas salegens]
MRISTLLVALLSLVFSNAQADVEEDITNKLGQIAPDMRVSEISPAPIAGLYQVLLEGGGVLYVSADAGHLIQGTLFDISGNQPRNLTAEAEAVINTQALEALDQDQLVIFAPQEPKTHVTIFTDVDCGYCRKLHEEIDELQALGIEVRYAAFVRAGLASQTAETMESVWCADDRQQAMTKAKRGEAIPMAECDNPLQEQLELGKRLGVRGTPAIFFANGIMLPGYKPAETLAAEAMANQATAEE